MTPKSPYTWVGVEMKYTNWFRRGGLGKGKIVVMEGKDKKTTVCQRMLSTPALMIIRLFSKT